MSVKLDVTRAEDARSAVEAAGARFGRIDVLVNNAGNFHAGFFEELSDAQIRNQIDTLLFGPVSVTRAVLPVMRRQRSGLVLTISSTAGIMGGMFCTAYAVRKSLESTAIPGLNDFGREGDIPPAPGVHAVTVSSFVVCDEEADLAGDVCAPAITSTLGGRKLRPPQTFPGAQKRSRQREWCKPGRPVLHILERRAPRVGHSSAFGRHSAICENALANRRVTASM